MQHVALTRDHFSINHLLSARMEVDLASEMERNHVGRPRHNPYHRAHVIGAVVSSAAFLEACINELLKGCYDRASSSKSFSEAECAALGDVWEKRERASILKKYQYALRACSRHEFDPGKDPYESAALVVLLRNVLVHYKPQTIDPTAPADPDERLTLADLAGRFPPNAMLSGADLAPWPGLLLGAGCARWAVESATRFADSFFSSVGGKPAYQVVKVLKNWK